MVFRSIRGLGNGQRTEAEPREESLRDSVQRLGWDAYRLLELQLKLCALDGKQALKIGVRGLIALVIGGVLLVSALPLVLFAIAQFLIVHAEWSPPWAYMTVGASGLVIAGVCLLLGRKHFGAMGQEWRPSKEEWDRNREWLKSVLRSRSS